MRPNNTNNEEIKLTQEDLEKSIKKLEGMGESLRKCCHTKWWLEFFLDGLVKLAPYVVLIVLICKLCSVENLSEQISMVIRTIAYRCL